MIETIPLFFNTSFSAELIWRGKPLRIGAITPANKKQISVGIKDLSQETIRNRFLGSKKEFSEKELVYFTQLDGYNHYALGIEENKEDRRGVGIVRLVRSSEDPIEAEVAITIIDDYQNQGLGTLLLELAILSALERNIDRLSFTVLPQNTGIEKLVSKMGPPTKGIQSMDYVQYFLSLKDTNPERIKEHLSLILPEVVNYKIDFKNFSERGT